MNPDANFDFRRLFAPRKLTKPNAADDKASVSTTRGFTLIELMLVIAIIGTLAAIAILSYNVYINQARVIRAIVEIKNIQNMITGYVIDSEREPKSLQDNKPGNAKNNKTGSLQDKLPEKLSDLGTGEYIDPWGRPYIYVVIYNKGDARKDRAWNPLNDDYDLYSLGADGETHVQVSQKGGKDDIIRAANGKRIDLGEKL